MKQIDNKFWLLISLVALILGACEDDYDAPGNEPSHVFVTSSNDRYDNKVQVNDTLTLSNLSRGVVKSLWTFPEGIADIVNSTNDKTSEGKTVKVSFNQVGEYEVPLHLEFMDTVWLGSNNLGVNVYDTVVTVTVLDSVRADFEARRVKDNSLLVNANNELNEVVAGREVLFTQLCAGEPDNFNWYIENNKGYSKSYDGETATHKFSSTGEYAVTLFASNPFGGDTISFEKYITVVASTDPVYLLDVTSKDKKIEMEFSRDINNPATCPPAAITLEVTNGDNTYPVNVASFSLKESENNVVILELDAEIYNSDMIKLSYDATIGNLYTTDGMKADSYSDREVFFIKENILASTSFDYSIENSTVDNWPYDWWGGVWGMYDLSISDAQAHTGNKSAYIVMEPGGGAIFKHKDDVGAEHTFPAQAGKTYEVGFWVYMESLGDGTSIPDFRFYWSPNTNWGIDPAAAFDAEWPEGKWVYGSTRVEFSDDGDYGFMIRGWNEQNSQECRFYFDDISVSELEIRP